MNWDAADYIIMAIMLSTTGVALGLTAKFVRKKNHRIAFSIGILFIFFLVWAELAVGIFH